jgi:hypothetical protein
MPSIMLFVVHLWRMNDFFRICDSSCLYTQRTKIIRCNIRNVYVQEDTVLYMTYNIRKSV